jgi:hypothetical protein
MMRRTPGKRRASVATSSGSVWKTALLDLRHAPGVLQDDEAVLLRRDHHRPHAGVAGVVGDL